MMLPNGARKMIPSYAETRRDAWEQAYKLKNELWLESVEIWDARSLTLVFTIESK